MDWESSYSDALAYAEGNIVGNALFAYNVNIDAVKHLKGGEKFPARISNLLKRCIRNGEEREVGIDKTTLEILMNGVGYDELRMGGQAGNMSNIASALGVHCYVHVPSKCSEQMKLFEHPEKIFIADGSFKNPPDVHEKCDVPVHFVMEFRKGYSFQNVKAPFSNRLIASFNPPCALLEIDEEFRRLAPRVIDTVNRAVVSGFHSLAGSNSRKIDKVRKHIEGLKRLNYGLKVHVELGDFQNLSVLREVTRKILPLCDSMGFNENELEQVKEVAGIKGNIWKSCDRICDMFCDAVFHCPQFSFLVTRGSSCEKPLLFGSLLAAHRAANGRNASFGELGEFVKRVKVNREGIKEYGEFRKIKFKNNAYFAPALDVGEPKMTVGLGDCFAAGYFLTK